MNDGKKSFCEQGGGRSCLGEKVFDIIVGKGEREDIDLFFLLLLKT